MGHIRNLDRSVSVIMIVVVVVTPHGVYLLVCFVVLYREEAILIKKYKNLM